MTDFKDVKFMTAKEKETVMTQWRGLIVALIGGKHGASLRPYFKRALYHHLMQHCGYIAHFDEGGFFSEYFEVPEDTLRFFKHFTSEGQSYCHEDYRDINGMMRLFLGVSSDPDSNYGAITRKMSEEQKNEDILRARMLLNKHGLKMEVVG